MITSLLIHAAMVAYAFCPFGNGWGGSVANTAPAKATEKVVIRESTLSEKLGMETIVQPDKEIAALRSSASGLESALVCGDKIKGPTPEKPPVAMYWKDMKDQFVLIWDDDKGFYFNGAYYPSLDPSDDCAVSFHRGFKSVKCVLMAPTNYDKENAARLSFKPDSCGRTPNDFFDYPQSYVKIER